MNIYLELTRALTAVMIIPNQFLSEEDLDLRNLSESELSAYWNLWLEQAQTTNTADEADYSHGVFATGTKATSLLTAVP